MSKTELIEIVEREKQMVLKNRFLSDRERQNKIMELKGLIK